STYKRKNGYTVLSKPYVFNRFLACDVVDIDSNHKRVVAPLNFLHFGFLWLITRVFFNQCCKSFKPLVSLDNPSLAKGNDASEVCSVFCTYNGILIDHSKGNLWIIYNGVYLVPCLCCMEIYFSVMINRAHGNCIW